MDYIDMNIMEKVDWPKFTLRIYLYIDRKWDDMDGIEREEIEYMMYVLYCKNDIGALAGMKKVERLTSQESRFWDIYYTCNTDIDIFWNRIYIPPTRNFTWVK